MNCESSDAILQTYIFPVHTSEIYSEASGAEEELISEPETDTELPVDESDLYFQPQYDENGFVIEDEDNLGNLDVRI